MQSEALRNVRTMRQVKTSLDVARRQKVRTTNSLTKTADEVQYLESLTDRRLPQVLQKERQRFAAHQAAVNKSRNRVLRQRDKMAITINRNRALTELRHELQRESWGEKDPAPPKTEPVAKQDVRQIELRY